MSEPPFNVSPSTAQQSLSLGLILHTSHTLLHTHAPFLTMQFRLTSLAVVLSLGLAAVAAPIAPSTPNTPATVPTPSVPAPAAAGIATPDVAAPAVDAPAAPKTPKLSATAAVAAITDLAGVETLLTQTKEAIAPMVKSLGRRSLSNLHYACHLLEFCPDTMSSAQDVTTSDVVAIINKVSDIVKDALSKVEGVPVLADKTIGGLDVILEDLYEVGDLVSLKVIR